MENDLNVYRHCPIYAAKRRSMCLVQDHMYKAHDVEKLFQCFHSSPEFDFSLFEYKPEPKTTQLAEVVRLR